MNWIKLSYGLLINLNNVSYVDAKEPYIQFVDGTQLGIYKEDYKMIMRELQLNHQLRYEEKDC